MKAFKLCMMITLIRLYLFTQVLVTKALESLNYKWEFYFHVECESPEHLQLSLSALPPKECLVMLCHQNASGLTCLDLSITDKWLVIDEAIPPLDYLIIEGGLHAASSASLHFTLNVNYIIISGRLAIGWENEPFNGTARIILRGQHSTPEVPRSGGPELGSKFIGKLTIFSQFFQFGSIFISSFSLVQSLEYKIMKSDFVFVAYQSLL